MCRDWIEVLTTGNKAFAWNVPASRVSELESAADAAEAALTLALNESTRTPVANAQCRAAFDALRVVMRDTKQRYFLSPPLTDADFISLRLKPHDHTPTMSGDPQAQAMVENFLIGRHELGLHIRYVSGDPNDPANKGFRIYYMVRGPGEPPVTDPETLTKSFFTRRMKDIIHFETGDSGSTVYFCVQIENDGKKGQWGPITSAIIP
jgi:hypothetical protein